MKDRDLELEYFLAYPEAKFFGVSALEHFTKYGQRLGYKLEVPRFLVISPNISEAPEEISQAIERVVPVARTYDIENDSISLAESCFDSAFYLASNRDVAALSLNPVHHYFSGGWRESRDPNDWFSTDYYLSENLDVAERGIEPLLHYLTRGQHEGRYPSFSAWYADRATRQLSAKTPTFRLQREVYASSQTTNTRIGVHVHCFYLDVFQRDVLQVLKKLPANCIYFISVCGTKDVIAVTSILLEAGLTIGRIAVVPNRGRDLAPLVLEFADDMLGYDLCLHIHTKKSVEKLELGSRWLRNIKKTLFPTSGFIENTIRFMMNDPSIGLVGPLPYVAMRRFMGWGANARIAQDLVARTGIDTELSESRLLDFPAGSFFWFKPMAFRTLYGMNLTIGDFPDEPIPDDGTIAHALERLLPVFSGQANLRYVEVEPMPAEATPLGSIRPNVSVIIPVYNAEQFIESAILSVINRTSFHYTFEIIAVDNNSSDNSRKVLDRLASIFPELRIFSQPIRGAGAARNTGLAQSRGEYISFLDADDLLTPDCIGNLYDCMFLGSGDDVDFATSSLRMFGALGTSHAMPFSDDGTYNVLRKEQYDQSKELWQTAMQDFGSCAKMYRADFLREKEINFPEGLNFEDNAFIGKAFLKANTVVILNKVTYLYRKTEVGVTQSTTISHEALFDQAKVLEVVIKDCDLSGDSDQQRYYIELLLNKLRDEANRMALVSQLPSILAELPLLNRAVMKSINWGIVR